MSGCLSLVIYIWLSLSGFLYLIVYVSMSTYFILFYFICMTMSDSPTVFVRLSLLGCLYPPALAGLWFAVYAMGVNVRLSLSGCLCLAVLVWLSVTGCLQNGWLTLSVCLCLIVCLWLSCLVMCDRLSMSDLQCLAVSRFVYVWLSIPGWLSLAVLSGCL